MEKEGHREKSGLSCVGPTVKFFLLVVLLATAASLHAAQLTPPQSLNQEEDVVLLVGPEGEILFRMNETKKCVPASTLKILTALTAIEYLGNNYRFQTKFFLSENHDLKVKGFGDPMLISEILQEITDVLSKRLRDINDLVLDDSYFAQELQIPGIGRSTNPYDASNGALCANFNTVFFKRDRLNEIVSAEAQTPMIPFASERIDQMGLKDGRHNVFRNREEIARYVGELLRHFLRERGVRCRGDVRLGVVGLEDVPIYTYQSDFSLEEVLEKMLAHSNNFVANQILIAVGAHVHGPPGTTDKGIRVFSDYCRNVLGLHDIEIAEGSGISRENRLSALDMLAILRHFEPHRSMLPRDGRTLYKSGSLKGVQARVGYIESESVRSYYFVIFMNRLNPNIYPVMAFIKRLTAAHRNLSD